MNDPHDSPHIRHLREYGRDPKTGETRSTTRRLYMQLQAWTGCADLTPVIEWLDQHPLDGILYRDFHDPLGVAFLVATEDPAEIPGSVREGLSSSPLGSLTPRPDMTMTGRTYTIGYETDLDRVLVHRPLERLSREDWPWAVWYPLKRKPFFYRLPDSAQREVLMEHGAIGQAFGAVDAAHDLRLCCFGMDPSDNDFFVGLVGRELQPLSAVVQTMRKTKQTARYIEHMGPFFVGQVAWRRIRNAS